MLNTTTPRMSESGMMFRELLRRCIEEDRVPEVIAVHVFTHDPNDRLKDDSFPQRTDTANPVAEFDALKYDFLKERNAFVKDRKYAGVLWRDI
ncbi:MAG: hypothetical protein NTX24_03020 [Candidatus Pacearchaeota archaeon]|nr:hypothetical protein [Candidatus Pacearchaeota archaeon]